MLQNCVWKWQKLLGSSLSNCFWGWIHALVFLLTDGLLHGPVPVPPAGWAQGEIHLQHHPVPCPSQSEQQVWELKTLNAHSTDCNRKSRSHIKTLLRACRVLFYGTCVYWHANIQSKCSALSWQGLHSV